MKLEDSNYNTTKYKNKDFYQLHEYCSEKFSVRWLSMNEAIIEVLNDLGIDPSTKNGKLLGSAMAYRLLIREDRMNAKKEPQL